VSENSHERVMNDLIKKVQQHEKTISQLVEIVGATNYRLSELDSKQKNVNQPVFSTS